MSMLSPINEPEYINPDVEIQNRIYQSVDTLSKLAEFTY